jgi:hypothetical protein
LSTTNFVDVWFAFTVTLKKQSERDCARTALALLPTVKVSMEKALTGKPVKLTWVTP